MPNNCAVIAGKIVWYPERAIQLIESTKINPSVEVCSKYRQIHITIVYNIRSIRHIGLN